MIYFDRIDVFEGTEFNKASKSKECDICHYWCFLNKGFKFQLKVCNGCDNLIMMSMNLSNITILNFRRFDYYCSISEISKNEAINQIQNATLSVKSGAL